ncbi:MAG TPA: site-specific integrase, partial [Terriglobia bacterium]|nr:site-specific integrase [Terriglobia bacterium]
MASKKVTLYIRPVLSDGSRPYLRPAYLRGGKLREGYALVQGHPQQVPNAEYYVRYLKGGKRVWEQVGCDAGVALAAQQRISTRMAAVQAGNTIPEDNRSSLTVSRAIEPYLQHVANKGRAENTPKNYAFTLRHFARECNKPLHLITAEDLITFGGRMRDQGYADSTIHHHLVEIGTFLKHYGFKDVLPPGDLPKFVAKTADSYHQDDLTRFFAACDDDDDRLLFEFFLASGYRGGEVRYATWADVDFAAGTATVRAKRTRTLNWKPKDRDERTVPLPDALVERLRERRRLHPNAFYIFGDGRNRLPYPIRRLRGIAFRAGLNCRECITPDGQSCREHAVCYRWTLHKFRRTYATLQHEIGGVSARTLQSLLGHSKLETTLRYLAVTDS